MADIWEDIIRLSREPISLNDVSSVHDDRAGGIAIFAGTTRAETSAAGRALVALDYEAYEPMALAQLHDLARRCRESWPVRRLALLHRVGRVGVSEPSVLVAVGCPHRGQAFDACRFLIDSLKREAAIWKKEIWDDGSASWVAGTAAQTASPSK